MTLSYCPKPKKSVLMITSMHESPDTADDPKRKPKVIEFYNSQRCEVDIVN